jgi:cephalosporin hydroxylase
MSQRLLRKLGKQFATDKITTHRFDLCYAQHFSALRKKKLKLIELGIGEEDYGLGGASLKMWEQYFTQADIYGVDLWDKSELDTNRIHTLTGDCTDEEFLNDIASNIGPFDIVIDDASHITKHTLRTLFHLIHHVRPGGYYVIEDIQTSYWPTHGGTSLAVNLVETPISWLKHAIDIINKEYLIDKDHYPLRAGFLIDSMHVYKNIAFLKIGRKKTFDKHPLPQSVIDDMRAADYTVYGSVKNAIRSFEENREAFFSKIK